MKASRVTLTSCKTQVCRPTLSPHWRRIEHLLQSWASYRRLIYQVSFSFYDNSEFGIISPRMVIRPWCQRAAPAHGCTLTDVHQVTLSLSKHYGAPVLCEVATVVASGGQEDLSPLYVSSALTKGHRD